MFAFYTVRDSVPEFIISLITNAFIEGEVINAVIWAGVADSIGLILPGWAETACSFIVQIL